MIKVKYGKDTYHVDRDLGEVYNLKLEKLSKNHYLELDFKKEEFINFLISLDKKKNKQLVHTEMSMREVLVENLKKDGKGLSYALTDGLLKGINYSVVKINDLTGTLSLVEKVKQKYDLEYVNCTFPLGHLKTDKLKKKAILKYISAPYGSHDKENLQTLPLLLPMVLS